MAPKPGAHKKARTAAEGADITKFCLPLAGREQEAARQAAAIDEAAPRRASPPLEAQPAAAATAAVAAPARRTFDRHLTMLQDMKPAESFAMSQDTDAAQVVWSDSPVSNTQQRGRRHSNLGRATADVAVAGAGGGASRELSAIKQRLISAAQRRRDAGHPTPAPAAAGRLQQSEQLLEALLARQQRGPGAAREGDGATAPPPERCPPPAGPAADGGGPAGAHRTPATQLRGILKRRGGGTGSGSRGRGRHTPTSVNFSLGEASAGGGRGRGGSGTPGGSGRRRLAGQKRKALLELLEQVESIVHSGGSPEGGAADRTPGTTAAGQQCAAGDKENSPAAAAGKASSQDGAVAAAAGRPTGSQQLMPPPGGVACRGAAAPPQPQPLRELGQPPHAAGGPAAAPPTAAAAGAAGGAAAAAGGKEEDEDDALMAQLELELLTQVEQRQAARQAGAAPPARPRLQAAPPPAQHPAAAPQQHRAPATALRRPLPRSPYERGAAPQAARAPKPAALTPRAAAAPPPPAPKASPPAASALASDGGSWDDDGFDADLLDQFEAAALKQRAGGGPAGAPPGVGPGAGAGPGVGAGGGRGPGAASPYPGDRERVHYQIREIYPAAHEQVLLLHNKYQKRDVYAHLHAPWADLPYRVGDTVNLLADLDFFEGHHHCLLSMERGMLILHPDVLLSGTRITTSHECPRRSFLDERVAGDGSNDKAVKGTLTHNLIQAALTQGLRTPAQLASCAERVVGEAAEALLEVELSEEAALACLKAAVPGILRWQHRFLRAAPAPDSALGAGMDYGSGRDVRRLVAVREVLDIEESIWSTKYGVKGMIDISAQLAMAEVGSAPRGAPAPGGAWVQAGAAAGTSHAAGAAAPGCELTVAPVEIKTGKAHDSHRAQVLLYLLLMEERYGRPLDWGMLWYTTQSDPLLVMKRPIDLACLMAVRNRLAAAIAHHDMPQLSEEKRQCNWCFQQLNCALAHKAQRGGGATADSFVRASTDRGGNLDRAQQELAVKYERAASHMSPADCEFLSQWERLVTLEEGHSTARRPEIWAMPGQERQALGRCVAGLVLSHGDERQLLYTFVRPDGGAIQCSFQEGEMLLLSVEGQHAAVARGYFYTCTAAHLTVSLNKALRRGLLLPGGPPPGGAPGGGGAAEARFDASVRWRLDRDDVSSTFVRLRGNLFALFRREFEQIRDPQTDRAAPAAELPGSLHAARLRRLVVGLEAPRLGAPAEPSQPDPTPPGMNSEQREAVGRVLRAKDYTLVLGMPGAGKTTTIVSMVQALVTCGKRVLLTSYTNSAVDNILIKLAREGVPFVRLGREAGVHPAIRPWVPGGERYPRKNTAELARLANTVPVFAATCFGVGHAMLKDRLFDVCIIDEAGQMVLPAALGPLLKARTFVLVGDHNQLPPLVTCKEAEAGGLGQSLFKRLSDAHPQAVVTLPVQYRMAADIMLLPNTLIYDNALRCGNDSVARAALELAPGAAALLPALPAWLQAALDPQRRVLFLDTSQVEGARETVAGDALSNGGEASLVLQLLRAAAAAGVAQEQMGAISPYRSQVALLDRLAGGAGLAAVEVLTVDKCQGRDKDLIAISLVRSNAEGETGKLLCDWRRVNVAITRAKRKLVLVGDASTLAGIPLFARLAALVRERGWLLQLPSDALAAATQP